MKHANNEYKPDFTAWFVLQGTIATMNLPEFYNKQNEAALKLYNIFATEAGKTRLLSKAIQKLSFPTQYKIGELVTNKGRISHYYLRKKEIEKQVRNLLADNTISQIVVLGAGLDILSLRLSSEYKSVNFIEIDTEESQKFKSESLSLHNQTLSENIELISGDLRNPLSEIMDKSRLFNSKVKTIWIAEGFLMFIPSESVVKLFKQIKALSEHSSYCVFTTIGESWNKISTSKAIQKIFLLKEKCPIFWLINSEKVPEFMQKMGITIVNQINSHMLQESHHLDKYNINHDIGDDIHIVKM